MVRRLTAPLVGPLGSIQAVTTASAVGLTFDDGPGKWTGPILDVLADHRASATFFMLADRADERPDLVSRVRAEGHEIALHGPDHTRLTTLPGGSVQTHIGQARQRLERLAGRPVRWFRPPYGSQNLRTFLAARRSGLEVVAWSCDADDWTDGDPSRVAGLASERLHPGGILLLHDGFESDPAAPLPEPRFDRAEALDQLLTALDHRRLEALDVSSLLRRGRARRTAWFRP
jgi:peptidoglycan/xylan/chitin deacetylase (PgdA/CDA1 family)